MREKNPSKSEYYAFDRSRRNNKRRLVRYNLHVLCGSLFPIRELPMTQIPFRKSVLVLATFLAMTQLTNTDEAFAQRSDVNYDEAKVPEFTLPDPLVLQDGTSVTDAKTWTARRRPELLELFKQHVFGSMPPAKEIQRVEKAEVDTEAIGGIAIRTEVTLHFSDDDSIPPVNVLILVPKTKSDEPVPAFLGYNFEGNHTIHANSGIRLSTVWPRKAGGEPELADESKRGSKASRWQVEEILKRGYALVTIYYGDVDPDFHDEFKNGIHGLYPEYQDRQDNWTSIGAWAWALSRTLDYLETEANIDASKVAVFGHSRLGKTSLWAGATDERFAMVISNNSGCGGAALARRRYGETVSIINNAFPHWFCTGHKQYSDNEDALPVDHHQLVSLIAPRPVYVASAKEDRWADPRGEFLSCLGADPVFRLLGTEGLPAKEWPDVHSPAHGQIGYHIRAGKHDVTKYDWVQYLDFADKHFRDMK